MEKTLNNKALISVIVPVYNVEQYLDKCISSIVGQTYGNIEVILVDDGSTDKSNIICDKWKSKDDRIIVIHKGNRGLVSARKAGLEAATGEYIGFVDADDYINECMYEEMCECLINHNTDFVYCGLSKHYENEKRHFDCSTKLAGEIILGKEKNTGVFFLNNYVFHADREMQMYTGGIVLGLYNSNFIKCAYMNVPDDCSQGEDLICLTWMILNARKMNIIPKMYYHYLIRTNSFSHKNRPVKYIENCRMIESIIDICKKECVYDYLKESIDFYLNKIMVLDVAMANPQLNSEIYSFFDEKELEGKRVVLYAAGVVGRCYRQQFSRNKKIDLVAWVDGNYEKIVSDEIKSPSILRELPFDIIVIASDSKEIGEEIKNELIKMGIDAKKIKYSLPMLNFE